uniref:UBX domain-containing protein n=1 Tax=Oryza punctata TaxID=4537 RepID=A0A0E0K0H2_ORYPU
MAGSDDMDDLVARFMDITMCDSPHAAANHLTSCRGSLDEALALYFATATADDEEEEPVRPPIPTRTERLYGDDEDDGYLMAAPPPPTPVPVHPPMPIPESFFQDAGYLRVVLSNSTPPVQLAVEETGSEEEEDAAEGEDACSVRVRFPDGRVVHKEFGATRPVAELFRYFHRHSMAGFEGGRRRTGWAFRLVRFAGKASEVIRCGDATFQDMGLHRWTLHLLFELGPRVNKGKQMQACPCPVQGFKPN